MKNKTKDIFVINKKVLWAFAPVFAIIGILISKHKIGPMILFILGIIAGIRIGIIYITTKKYENNDLRK